MKISKKNLIKIITEEIRNEEQLQEVLDDPMTIAAAVKTFPDVLMALKPIVSLVPDVISFFVQMADDVVNPDKWKLAFASKDAAKLYVNKIKQFKEDGVLNSITQDLEDIKKGWQYYKTVRKTKTGRVVNGEEINIPPIPVCDEAKNKIKKLARDIEQIQQATKGEIDWTDDLLNKVAQFTKKGEENPLGNITKEFKKAWLNLVRDQMKFFGEIPMTAWVDCLAFEIVGGNVKVSVNSKPKWNYVNNQGKEIDMIGKEQSIQLNEQLLKQIILEELTKTEVKEIAKKEAEKVFTKLLKDELEDHLVKLFKKRGGASREEVSVVARDMIKKLYRELAFNYPQILDKIKL